jgi:hypothetical protein
MNLDLQTSALPKELTTALQSLNIHWTNHNSNIPAPKVFIQLQGSGTKRTVTFSVQSEEGKTLIKSQTLHYKTAEQTAKELGYRLFAIGNDATTTKEQTQ